MATGALLLEDIHLGTADQARLNSGSHGMAWGRKSAAE